jgi:hypothetical protein
LGNACDVDGDADGYTTDGSMGTSGEMTLDCNDLNAEVSPGVGEIGNDGIDNDCNPLTVDSPYAIVFETPLTDLNTFLPTPGDVVTVKATVRDAVGEIAGASVDFTFPAVTSWPGAYSNDSSTDTGDDVATQVSGNDVNLTFQDHGGSITIHAESVVVIDGIAVNVVGEFTVPSNSDASDTDHLPDAYEALYGADLEDGTDAEATIGSTANGDGKTALQEYRGWFWGPELEPMTPAGSGGMYLTDALVPPVSGPVEHFRSNPVVKKDLFLKYKGFGVCNTDPDLTCPFALGTALQGIGIKVHAADADSTSPPSEDNVDVVNLTYSSQTYLNSAGNEHTYRRGVRSWDVRTLGFTPTHSNTVYGRAAIFSPAMLAYYSDRPFTDGAGAVASNGAFDPITDPAIEDGNDNGSLDRREDSANPSKNGVLDGDQMVPGSYGQIFSTFDVDDNFRVELPVVSNIGAIDTSLETPFPQAVKHVGTHELIHAVGPLVHYTDDEGLMHEISNNWIRDGFLTPAAVSAIVIH